METYEKVFKNKIEFDFEKLTAQRREFHEDNIDTASLLPDISKSMDSFQKQFKKIIA